MDTQDFVESLKTWTEIYRQNRDPALDYPVSTDTEESRWEENMLRIAAVIKPVDSITNTPAYNKIDTAIEMAKAKDRNKLKEIYLLLHEVEEYLKETMV